MTGESEQRLAELELQVAELRRVNEQLGRDLIRGAGSREPRSPVAAGRALAKPRQEVERARAQLEEAQQQLREANAALDHFRRENEQLRFEAARLRFGVFGFLRRALARLLGR
jgi:multidrug efflux pump subunit AcrA (membrane-fusion protein)